MKILSVNEYINTKVQNFSGLWGKTSVIVDRDAVLGVTTDTETYYYYPFSDESQEDINKTINRNKTAYFDHTAGDKYVIKECKLCTTLPFKEVHFNNYKNADMGTKLIPNIKKVHYSVLDKYINNFGEQNSAVNPIIQSRLNAKV